MERAAKLGDRVRVHFNLHTHLWSIVAPITAAQTVWCIGLKAYFKP
jgi:hypothetical protein